MNLRQYTIAALAFSLAIVAADADSGMAHAQRRSNNARRNNEARRRQELQAAVKETQARLTAANQRLAALSAEVLALQGQVAAAKGTLESAAGDVRNSKSEADVNTQRVREIEEQLEAAQPNDSPLALARADYQSAKEALEEAAARVFASENYKARYQEALQGIDRVEAVPKLKAEALRADAAYQRAKIVFDATRQLYEQERMALFSRSEARAEATQAVREALGEQAKAEQKAQGGALHKMSASAKLRDATKAALATQAQVNQLTSTLNSLQGSLKKLGGTTPSSSSGKK